MAAKAFDALKFSVKFALFSLMFAALALLCAYTFNSCNGGELEADGRVEGGAVEFVIDAGHGGMDGGASGADGIPESGLNLAVSELLRDICEITGHSAVMTRESDVMLDDGGAGSKKSRDLRARLNIAEAHPSALFISIHMNKYPSESCRGLQVWYSPNTPESKAAAERVQNAAHELLDSSNNRLTKSATSSIYLLDRAKTPAILIECGFLSCPEESRLLQSPLYRQKTAAVIFYGIIGGNR